MKVELKTGLGYIIDENGNILRKFDLPKGEHLFPDNVEVVEVKSREELDTITVMFEEE